MTYPAPKYLEDDPWFGPATFSLNQKEYKLAYDQAVAENLLLADNYTEVKNILLGEIFFSDDKQNFAINFEATPFLGESFFLMLHKQKFARNFEATPFLGESIFSDAT